MNNHKEQRATSKITKEPKQKSRLGTASNKNYWGAWTSLRSTSLAIASALVHQTKQVQTTKTKRLKHKQKAKRAAGIEEQVATMLESLQGK